MRKGSSGIAAFGISVEVSVVLGLFLGVEFQLVLPQRSLRKVSLLPVKEFCYALAPKVYLSIYLSIYLFIYLSMCVYMSS